jgi:predicted  nucleic acid-binding Zn-ribbon protein
MVNNPIFVLADELKQLRDQKTALEADLKDVNAKISATDYKLSELMAEAETQNFTRAGTMFYLTTTTRAAAEAGMKEDLYAALKENGYGSLVTETVNANSLSAFVRERIEENAEEHDGKEQLPDWLNGLVSVFDKTTVGVRKASK